MFFEISISVIMPVYNTPIIFLQTAVESILKQTFQEFEFIIVDDGTTNTCKKYLERLKDPRIRIIHNEKNLGITKSLNIGLKVVRGKYIARMDSDDISLPDRLKAQYDFMEQHPDVIVCGSKTGKVGDISHSYSLSGKYRIEDMEMYRIKLLFANPGPVHPTAFIRHEELINHHIMYDEGLYYAQDYGMWETISHYGMVCFLEDVLLLRREHENQITKAHRERQIQCDKKTQRKLLIDLLGNVTDEELDMHYIHSTGNYPNATIKPVVSEWYERIINANDQRHLYNKRKLNKYVQKIIKKLVSHSFKKNMSKLEKTYLIFQYLPIFTAIKMTSEIVFVKVQFSGKSLLNKYKHVGSVKSKKIFEGKRNG